MLRASRMGEGGHRESAHAPTEYPSLSRRQPAIWEGSAARSREAASTDGGGHPPARALELVVEAFHERCARRAACGAREERNRQIERRGDRLH